MSDPFLKEAYRLHRVGFACHWLQPKSKKPVKARWTTGPREELEALRHEYRDGMNLGVRLGRASRVRNGFLAVVDCDVKSADAVYRLEMEDALGRVFKALPVDAPRVETGRGGGSCHIYVATPEPIAPKRLAQSNEKVKVYMPSVLPSRSELGILTELEIKAGWRLRAAWEISLMGEGQQVVLPPSLHPDSGKPYVWGFPFTQQDQIVNMGALGTVAVDPGAAKPRPELQRNGDFKAIPVDLVGSDLSAEIVDMILSGKGCDDRSVGLFKAACAMCREGFSDEEILSVLTDPDTYLGQTPFDHAQTKSRGRAAKWLYKYTLAKARDETDAAKDFEAVEITKNDDDGDGGVGAGTTDDGLEALGPEKRKWQDRLERTKEKEGWRVKNTLLNCVMILEGEFGKELFSKNEFSDVEIHTRKAPWGGGAGKEISNADLVMIKHWFALKWRMEPALDRVGEAITVISKQNPFHPVREYLDTLDWDGVKRIDTWLADYLDARAGSDAYLESVGRKVLCAMIARIYHPGVKFDYVVILEGRQGVGKSTAVRAICGDEWFSDAHINVADKDGVLSMRAAWVVELGELGGMRKADVDQLKEFISRTTDRIRVPYGRRTEGFPRQCIFIATTNGADYLKDQTGNRRFWPVNVGQCDFEGLRRDRDQLLAEAKFAWEMGETLYLDQEDAAATATVEQEQRTFTDTWVAKLDEFLKAPPAALAGFDPGRFTLTELFQHGGPFQEWKEDRANQIRAGDALRKLGYGRERTTDEGVRKYYYVRLEGLRLDCRNMAQKRKEEQAKNKGGFS